MIEAVEVAGRGVGDAEGCLMTWWFSRVLIESVWTEKSVVARETVLIESVWVAMDIEKGAVTIMAFVCVDTATVGAKRASTQFSTKFRACEVVASVVCVETDEVGVDGGSV